MDPANPTDPNTTSTAVPSTSSVLDPQRPVYIPTTPTEDDSATPFGGAQTAPISMAPQVTSQTFPSSSPAPTDNGLPPAAPTEVITANPGSSGGNKKKQLLAVLGVFLTLVGVGSGVFLVRRQQLSSSLAWDCSLYSFALSDTGTVSVTNGSNRNELPQSAEVYINNSLVDTFSVPALDSGDGVTLGTVSVPTGTSYTWRIKGTVDCQNSGEKQVTTLSAQCTNVIAYDENWLQLNATDLSQLKAGDTVRFTVQGTATSGTIDKARFSINGGASQEVTAKKPGTEEYYYEYIIPAGTTSFSVTAQVFHSQAGWF